MLPLKRLQELESMEEIGHSAPRHYSIMGYSLNPEQMLRESVPAIIENLLQDQVDIVSRRAVATPGLLPAACITQSISSSPCEIAKRVVKLTDKSYPDSLPQIALWVVIGIHHPFSKPYQSMIAAAQACII